MERAYTPLNISSVLDTPFALLYIGVLFLLSPVLAGVVLVFAAGVMAFSVVMRHHLEKPTRELTLASSDNNSLIGSALQAADGIRGFNAAEYLGTLWAEKYQAARSLSGLINSRQGFSQSFTHVVTISMNVFVIAIGAALAVAGKMDVGSLIGANILASRALVPIIRFSQLGPSFVKARQSQDMLRQFVELPHERSQGSTLRKYTGALELRDLSFTYPGSTALLIERLSMKLEPGKVLLVHGGNGAGKTTLARLIVGILTPAGGQVLMDGVDTRQLDPQWMRQQLIYLPQEPVFFNGTIRENLSTLNPRIDEMGMERIAATAGLTRFLEESAEGLETGLENGGSTLSPGVRRRLALARALSSTGPLAILDEPTDGLDKEGRGIFAKALNAMVKSGKTIIVFCHDDSFIEGADLILDLDLDTRRLSVSQNAKPDSPLVAAQ